MAKIRMQCDTAEPTCDVGPLTDGSGFVKNIIIPRICDPRIFYRLDYDLRHKLIKEEMKKYRQDIVNKYGSQSNYQRQWLRRKGVRKIDYLNANARRKGFTNQAEYITTRYQLKGFDDKPDYERFKRFRRRFDKSVSDFHVRELQLRNELWDEHRSSKFTADRRASFEQEVRKRLDHFILIRRSMRSKKHDQTHEPAKNTDHAVPARVGAVSGPTGGASQQRNVPSNGNTVAKLQSYAPPQSGCTIFDAPCNGELTEELLEQ